MTFVVTAGPTREHRDPVRFLSNPSTGKMGFAVAAAAAKRLHPVTLVSGPVSLPTPRGVKRVDVVSAREMLAAVEAAVREAAGRGETVVVVSTAAVADWRPAKCAAKKLKKSRMGGTLRLVRNPDILKTLSRRASVQCWSDSQRRRATPSPRRAGSAARRGLRSLSPTTSRSAAAALERTPTA